MVGGGARIDGGVAVGGRPGGRGHDGTEQKDEVTRDRRWFRGMISRVPAKEL